jgi:glucosamine kinase
MRPVPSLLAVDAGGTSTRAVVLNPDGTCLGYGAAGSGNPISSGVEHAAQQVAAAVAAALAPARRGAPELRELAGTTVLAMAGSRVRTDNEWVAGSLRELGVSGPIVFENDILAMFCSGAWELDGYGIVAGTGAAAIRVHGGRPDRTSDGLGWLIGDDGSGFWIGQRVVRAVGAALGGRAPQTALTGLLLDTLGIPLDLRILDPEDGRAESLKQLVDAVYRLRPIELARFAPLVFRASDDAVATDIVRRARTALLDTLASIDAADVRGPVVCGGGVLGALGIDTTTLQGATDTRHVGDGAVGAAVLALRDNGHEVDQTVFERIRDTLTALRV